MDRGSQRNHHVPHILFDAQLGRGGQVGGDGGDAAAGGQCRHRRGGNHAPEPADSLPAPGQEGVQGEENGEIEQGHRIVDGDRLGVGADQLGSEFPHQRRKIGAQTDGGVPQDDPHQFDQHLGQGIQSPGHHLPLFPRLTDRDAEESGHQDQGQHAFLG